MGEDVVKLIKENNITAVFCCQDELAIGLINYCYDNDIKVRRHFYLWYGDTKMASIYRPNLQLSAEPYEGYWCCCY